MNKTKGLTFFYGVVTLVCVILFTSTSLHAVPMVDPACEGLTGQARGICISATQGVKCNTRKRNQNSEACARLEETFRAATGTEPTWLPEKGATGMDWIDLRGDGEDYAIDLHGYLTSVDTTLQYTLRLIIAINDPPLQDYIVFDQKNITIDANTPVIEVDVPGVETLLVKLDLETGELSWRWRRDGIKVASSLAFLEGVNIVNNSAFDPRYLFNTTHRVSDER